MSTKMQVTMKLDQRLMMSQQLRQAIALLQYNTLDLKQLVQQHVETNPLLEVEETEAENHSEEDEDFQVSSNSSEEQSQSGSFSANLSKRGQAYEDESTLENYSIPKSLREHLLDQTLLCRFSELEQLIAIAIIDAIDENGYLTMSLDDIQKTIVTSEPIENAMLETVLKTVQTFDPVGVASRDIRECMLIQLASFSQQDQTWENARKIITSEYFEDFATSNEKKMIKHLGLSCKEYTAAMALIRTFNPHPGDQYSSEVEINIEPELFVKKIKIGWQVFLADSILTNVKINGQYQAVIKQNKKHSSYQALKQELEEAKALLNGLRRRNETLLLVAMYIMEFQSDFLDLGHTYMKPMNIVDVAQSLELHESTISRITTGKFIATPRGVFELKYFFPSHVFTNTGEACSAIAVKAHIKEILNQETSEHIYSDSEIAALLEKKGINIARRTVAKYREAMKILPSYQRMGKSASTSKSEELDSSEEITV